jgi:hypothetical protein
LVMVRVLSEWQTRQSSSDITGAAVAPTVKTSQIPAKTKFRIRTALATI